MTLLSLGHCGGRFSRASPHLHARQPRPTQSPSPAWNPPSSTSGEHDAPHRQVSKRGSPHHRRTLWLMAGQGRRERGTGKERSVLAEWPVVRPSDRVNQPEAPAELEDHATARHMRRRCASSFFVELAATNSRRSSAARSSYRSICACRTRTSDRTLLIAFASAPAASAARMASMAKGKCLPMTGSSESIWE
jgi:hypothetical protein